MSNFKLARRPLRSFVRLFSPRRRAPDRELDHIISEMECDIWEDYNRDPEEQIEKHLTQRRVSIRGYPGPGAHPKVILGTS